MSEKKVGILTFVEADNYGAMCQAVALQKVVENLGYNSELIRYRNASLRVQYHYRKLKDSSSVSEYVKRNIAVQINRKRIKKFEKYRRNLSISKVLKADELEGFCKKYYKVIVGSDQVWNPRNTSGDLNFLLQFLEDDRKKIAYAASFGNTAYFSEFNNMASQLIHKIPQISVREKAGEAFLKAAFDIESTCVLDPVLLLKKDEWGSMCGRIACDNYVFVYQLRPNNADMVDFTNRCSKFFNCKAVVLPYLVPCLLHSNQFANREVEYNLDPGEFVARVKGARCVITDSFHGVALSIANHVDFWVFVDRSKENTNERIISLLRLCHLEDRIVQSDTVQYDNRIDYESVERVLMKAREESLSFLGQAVSAYSSGE